jgi:serine/threonine protein kinase
MEKLQEKSKKYKEGVRAKQVKSENVKITLEGASLSETIASLQNEQRKRSIPEVPLPPLPKEGAKEGGLISSLQKEVQLLMRLQHPNIIKIYQVIDSDTECHIVMFF